MPEIEAGTELLKYFFEIGPAKSDGHIDAGDLLDWQEILGIEWRPFESRLLIRLSKAYLGAMQAATKRDAACPWPEFEKQWKWVQAQQGERRLDAFLK